MELQEKIYRLSKRYNFDPSQFNEMIMAAFFDSICSALLVLDDEQFDHYIDMDGTDLDDELFVTVMLTKYYDAMRYEEKVDNPPVT